MYQVVIGGGPDIYYPAIIPLVKYQYPVVCVDSGADHAKAMEILPEVLIGDLDSIQEGTLDWIHQNHIPVQQFFPEKDMTDSELGLRSLDRNKPILFVVSLGGRPDHMVMNLLLGAKLAQEGYDISITDGKSWIFPKSGSSLWQFQNEILAKNAKSQIEDWNISILPIFNPVKGVSTSGLYYPLTNKTIFPGSSLTISNKISEDDEKVEVSFNEGTALIMLAQ